MSFYVRDMKSGVLPPDRQHMGVTTRVVSFTEHPYIVEIWRSNRKYRATPGDDRMNEDAASLAA